MDTLYYEDCEVGVSYLSKPVTVSLQEIIEFAQTYDPQPFHIDPKKARESIFGGLVSSGFMTLLFSFRQIYELGYLRESSLGASGLDDLRWLAPVRPGDQLRTRAEVVSRRESKDANRGTVVFTYTVFNQADAPVMRWTGNQLIRRRNPAS